MKSITGLPVLLIGLLLACGSSEEESPMEGMSAEEHAMMTAGGTQGEVDSTGAMVRQPVHLSAAQERALGVVYTMVRRGTMTRTIRQVSYSPCGRLCAASVRAIRPPAEKSRR